MYTWLYEGANPKPIGKILGDATGKILIFKGNIGKRELWWIFIFIIDFMDISYLLFLCLWWKINIKEAKSNIILFYVIFIILLYVKYKQSEDN